MRGIPDITWFDVTTTTISVPAERLIFDLLVHESLDFALTPEVRAAGGVFMERSDDAAPGVLLPIPVPQSVVQLPGQPPVVATMSVPRYPEIVSFVYDKMRWSAPAFRGCRMELTYPPLGSTARSLGRPGRPPGSWAFRPSRRSVGGRALRWRLGRCPWR